MNPARLTAAHTLNPHALQLSGSMGAGCAETRASHPPDLPGPYSECSAGLAWSRAGVPAHVRDSVCVPSGFSRVQLSATLRSMGDRGTLILQSRVCRVWSWVLQAREWHSTGQRKFRGIVVGQCLSREGRV